MILSGKEIKRAIADGEIIITPFDERKVNPNSVNLTLSNELMFYKEETLDMKKANDTESLLIPDSGIVLEPNKLYLGRTNEFTATDFYIPMLEGRSSTGRLGLFIHVTAGFGDVGFKGFWTLEMFCIEPIKIYPNVDICQIYYHTIKGDFELYKSGKYQNNSGIQPSLMYKDFAQEK
jgi:dCTP deaminase